MEKEKLILKDGTEIELQVGARMSALGVLSEDRAAMAGIWERLTKENLSEVQVKDGQGMTVGRHAGLLLESETSVVQADGKIYTVFRLRQQSDVEKRIDGLEVGLEIHDGAIMDMAEVIGGIVEAQEGGGI